MSLKTMRTLIIMTVLSSPLFGFATITPPIKDIEESEQVLFVNHLVEYAYGHAYYGTDNHRADVTIFPSGGRANLTIPAGSKLSRVTFTVRGRELACNSQKPAERPSVERYYAEVKRITTSESENTAVCFFWDFNSNTK